MKLQIMICSLWEEEPLGGKGPQWVSLDWWNSYSAGTYSHVSGTVSEFSVVML